MQVATGCGPWTMDHYKTIDLDKECQETLSLAPSNAGNKHKKTPRSSHRTVRVTTLSL